MGILDGNRFRRGGCFKRSCGYSTQVRNGTCCRRAIRTTRLWHRRFQTWCSNEVLRRVLTDVANELRDKGVLDEEESFIDATFAMAKGGGAEIGPTKRVVEGFQRRRLVGLEREEQGLPRSRFVRLLL